MTIRSARAEDAVALQELYGELHPQDPAMDTTAFGAKLATIVESVTNRLLVYEADGMIVSTCYLNIVPNLTRNMRSYAVIENVVTLAAHRKKGYATALLQHAMDQAREAGCYKVMLMTGSKRESTHRFYKHAGLEPGQKTAFHTRLD